MLEKDVSCQHFYDWSIFQDESFNWWKILGRPSLIFLEFFCGQTVEMYERKTFRARTFIIGQYFGMEFFTGGKSSVGNPPFFRGFSVAKRSKRMCSIH